jgi:ATP-dependent protease HslVU (ClpYQ) peptidase subunit
MTVLAYRNGVLAADTSVWSNNVLSGEIVKIARRRDGALIGIAGSVAAGQTMIDHFLKADGLEIERPDEVECIVVDQDGKIITYDADHIAEVEAEFEASGAGYQIAHGALAAGASAEEAVAIAIQNHAKCSGDVISLSHNSGRLRRRTPENVLRKLNSRAKREMRARRPRSKP